MRQPTYTHPLPAEFS